eukprot:TRINITY_DN48987_c0_g1_i1.p1 TRINITY_DN48987_c0_g1~~TRINITY_DN48987_c0_g1_i1.p1  ORF type:complete len:102 (+),score=4.64 TRINITY_DN48987_c0_g1_i1:151-456(+)
MGSELKEAPASLCFNHGLKYRPMPVRISQYIPISVKTAPILYCNIGCGPYQQNISHHNRYFENTVITVDIFFIREVFESTFPRHAIEEKKKRGKIREGENS